jgi:hypothetical protein
MGVWQPHLAEMGMGGSNETINSKHEARNPKQYRMFKNSNIQKFANSLSFICLICDIRGSTIVESIRQIDLFFQNEPNPKDRIQNAEDGIQNKKMCINACSIKDCAVIFPSNPLDCFQGFVGGRHKTNPNRSQF